MRTWGVLLWMLLPLGSAWAQWEEQKSGTTVRLRGVSAVDARVAWASGDRGTFARTTNGGRTWQHGTVPGADALDFRDVDAFGPRTAYLLAIGEGERSRIYKTTDGGKTWALQFQNRTPGAFFDAMAFWDEQHGIAFSDPVNGRFLLLSTSDGGATWTPLPQDALPPALEGEGGFAASGTSIAVAGKSHVWFGTGGPQARVFHSADRGRTWTVTQTPLASGDGAGVFSLVFWNEREGAIVGGNYKKPGDASGTVALTRDGGSTWETPRGTGPRGYRSCVARVPGAKVPTLIAVGPTGADVSHDGGASWAPLGDTGFHAVSIAGPRNAGWAVGEEGRIGRLTDVTRRQPRSR
ncbi:MAG: oxidoreductase [Myxococcaceae bacterium]|nr:oxidoreductase [Myxococcaceae bacterium]